MAKSLLIYDPANRLTSVIDPMCGTTSFTYDPAGYRVSQTRPDGSVTTDTRDALGRILARHSVDAFGNTIASFTYTLSDTGRRTSVLNEEGRRTVYGYDALDRLVEERVEDPTSGAWVISFAYDDTGNMVSRTDPTGTTLFTYDANDRLIQAGDQMLIYDANGNTIASQSGTESVQYVYDFENRLSGMTSPGTSLSLEYDGDGLLVGKTVNGSTTTFLQDSNREYAQIIEETESDGVTYFYVHGDEILSQHGADGDHHYHTDGHQSVVALTQDREVTDRYEYDAWGNLTETMGQGQNPYRYTGERFDPDLGLYYLRARYYNPNHARFQTMDTWSGDPEIPITLHKYAYANADPVNGRDPSGNVTLTELNITVTYKEDRAVVRYQAGRKTIKKVTCKLGAAFFLINLRDMSRKGLDKHHLIPKSISPNSQSLIYLPRETHSLFHIVHNLILRHQGLPPGNTSALKWTELLSQNKVSKTILYESVLNAAKIVDKICKLKKPRNLETAVRKERRSFLGD